MTGTNGYEDSRKRVIQLGEDPKRVFNYGSTSIDNIMTIATMSKQEALESIGLNDCKYALCTYHPVTMDNNGVDEYVKEFITAIKAFPDIQFIITKSNADQGGARINELLDEAAKEVENIHVYISLGARRYLSLMRYAEFVIGNSLSGIIETPAFHVPTINIGERQKGRLQSESIINCGTSENEIMEAVNRALSPAHKAICCKVRSPYGDGETSNRIASKAIEIVLQERISLKKPFFSR